MPPFCEEKLGLENIRPVIRPLIVGFISTLEMVKPVQQSTSGVG
jgi:hypothetical protein